MGFGEAVRTGFSKYATFQGRAARSEYWYWVLFTVLVSVVLNGGATAMMAAGAGPDGQMTGIGYAGVAFSFLNLIFALGTLLPGIAVTVRRLHDTDHSGWWYFIVLTGVGAIVLLVWFCQRGTAGANRFGLGTSSNIAGVFGDTGSGYAPAASLDRSRF